MMTESDLKRRKISFVVSVVGFRKYENEWRKKLENGLSPEDLKEAIKHALANSISAATSVPFRGYKDFYAKPDQKDKVERDWKEQLERIGESYGSGGISESAHIDEIRKIAKYLSDKHECILIDKTLRFGVSQKALNLYLKYLWCFGQIKTPPHCPIDRIILDSAWKENTLGVREILRSVCYAWTKSDCVEDYQGWIKACNKVAEEKGYPSLSEWELVVWSEEKENE